MSHRRCIVTAVTRSWAPYAQVWAGSIRAQHHDVDLLVAVLDGDEEDVPEGCDFVSLDELAIPDVATVLYRYSRQALIVAAKAFLLLAARRRGYDRVLFLDADILILDSLDGLLDTRHSVLLTPHLLAPSTPEMELWVTMAGVNNGGCIAVDGSLEALAFLEWFTSRLHEGCVHDVAGGLHYDQTWLDLAPTLHPGVGLHRDVGVNVAYWNLAQRSVTRAGERWLAGGEPLRFFHFSGYDPRTPEVPSLYRPGLLLDEMGGAESLFERYHSLLVAAGAVLALDMEYGLGRLADGTPIPPEVRDMVVAGAVDLTDLDPRTSTSGDVAAELVRQLGGDIGPWRWVWQRRPDLRALLADPFDGDPASLDGWIDGTGRFEHPELFQMLAFS